MWHARRREVLSLALAGVNLVGLAGCGASTAPTEPSPAAERATASPVVTASPAPSASPVVGELCIPTPIPFDPDSTDVTGTWAGNDGGIYYVRQVGSVVWWNGMSGRDAPPEHLGRNFNNVGRGEITDDLTIVSDWVDVPRGGIDGGGTVTWQIGGDAAGNLEITKIGETGSGRGDSIWTPCTLGFPGG